MSCIVHHHVDAGSDRHPSGDGFSCSVFQRLAAPFFVLRAWYKRRRQLKALVDLDDRLLKDIGVSRAEAMHEYYEPFWQVYSRRHLR